MQRVEETRRIGWSPIATDRRPIGRQNILRSGVLTISSIKLSSRVQADPGAGSARRGECRPRGARKIANLLNAPAIILREKLCICISCVPSRRTGNVRRAPVQISASRAESLFGRGIAARDRAWPRYFPASPNKYSGTLYQGYLLPRSLFTAPPLREPFRNEPRRNYENARFKCSVAPDTISKTSHGDPRDL